MNSLFSGGKKNMKPQEKKLVDASEKILDLEKIKKQITVIQLLNDEQASSIISNLSAKMKMIAEIGILDQLGGLNLSSFLAKKIFALVFLISAILFFIFLNFDVFSRFL